MIEAAGRQIRERSGHRLAALARAQQQLAAQLAQPAGRESFARAIADAAMVVFPCGVSELYRFQGAELGRVVRFDCPSAGAVNDSRVPEAPAFDPPVDPPVDLTLAYAAGDSGVAHLASHLFDTPDAPRGTTELCAPVRDHRRGSSVLRLVSRPGATFDGEDLHLVAILTGHAATADEAARLVAAQTVHRRRAELQAAIARVALDATNLQDGIRKLVDLLDAAIPVAGIALGVARQRDGQIEYLGASGAVADLQDERIAPDRSDVIALPLVARTHRIGELRVTLASSGAVRARPQRIRRALLHLETPLTAVLDALLLDEEERLAREREHLLASALTTINHPIFILDGSGIRYANPAAAREYGWSQAELMEMRFEELVVGADTREGLDVGSGLVEPGVRVSHDIHRRRAGADFPAAVSVSALVAHGGDLLGQVISVRNVSTDRHLEEQLRHTEKMVALGELVAGVAHEINNPLTGISAFAQILLEDALTLDQRESVQLIKQESDRASTVIRDLLLFARKTDRGFGPVPVNAMLSRVVRLRNYPLRNAGVTVALDLDERDPTINGDEQKLQQVLLNLISNAEFAMQERAQRILTLSTRSEGDVVRLVVSDTGRGMTAEVRRRIFEPFYTTKPAGIGTGLGLSVSYGIVHAHGGSISVDSEPDVGTTVSLLFPLLVAPPS